MSKPTKPFSFEILPTTKAGRARLGLLKTPHGTIQTPAYVIVATDGVIRTLKPSDIPKTGTQMVIANTYHLWDKKNVHKILGRRLPMMTDSGGFQVFSLGAAKEYGVGKVLGRAKGQGLRVKSKSGVRITEKGVYFKVEGHKRFLSPESSIAIQERLGADIIFAFDECTSPLHSHAHTKTAMQRTHRWAIRSLKVKRRKGQALFGIVQGGRFASLRRASAKAIAGMGFDGFGIGGSFGKDEMVKTLGDVIPHLPNTKPRHLLGIGTVDDIFAAVQAGVDTMDCVIPTREARHGRLYTDTGRVDIHKAHYARDRRQLLGSRTNLATLHRLFKAKDPKAGRLATLHNVTWFNRLLKDIRSTLADGSYPQFKQKFKREFYARRK